MLLLASIFAIAVLLTYFWPQIRSFLSRIVLPWIHKNWGEKFFEPLVAITEWLDGKIRGIRRGFKDSIRFIKERVLNMNTKIVRQPGGVISGTTTTELKGENGEVVVIKTTKPVDAISLPVDIQNAIIKQMPDKDGNRNAQLDEKQLLIERAKERLAKDRQLAQTREEVVEAEEAAQILDMAVA